MLNVSVRHLLSGVRGAFGTLLASVALLCSFGTFQTASALGGPEAHCYQRGVGDMEAFGEIFRLGGNYGRTRSRKDGVTNASTPRPVHPFGDHSGPLMIDLNDRLQYGPFMEAQRNLRFYAQLGHAGYREGMQTGQFPLMASISIDLPGRGSILTYGPGTKVLDVPYRGNIQEPTVFIGDDRKLWGVTPDFLEGEFPEGEQSVSILCKDHPVMKHYDNMKVTKAPPYSQGPPASQKFNQSSSYDSLRKRIPVSNSPSRGLRYDLIGAASDVAIRVSLEIQAQNIERYGGGPEAAEPIRRIQSVMSWRDQWVDWAFQSIIPPGALPKPAPGDMHPGIN